MKMNSRPGLKLALVALCLAAGAARAQYVEDSIDVGGYAVRCLVYNGREDVLYGGCYLSSVFFAISCDSDKVIGSFPFRRPRGMAFDSTDNKAYCSYAGADEESLAIVDGTTHTLTKSIRMPGATTPVWDPVYDRVYVSCQTTDKVAVVDCRTDSLLDYIPVGACPINLHINTLRRKLYVQNYDDGTISFVDMATNQVIKTLAVGGHPNAGYYSREADKYYTAASPGHVAAIDGQGDSVIALIPVSVPSEVMSATGNEHARLVMFGVYSAYCFVYTVSTVADSVTASVQVTGIPYGLLYSETADRLYCGNGAYDSVSVFTGDGERIVKTLAAGEDQFVFARAPRHSRVYVGGLGSRLFVIRDTAEGVEEDNPDPREAAGAVRVWPNPFSRAVTVTGNLGESPVRIYSPLGVLVGTATPTRAGGRQSCTVWDGQDGAGQSVPAGVYVVEAAGVRVKVVKLR